MRMLFYTRTHKIKLNETKQNKQYLTGQIQMNSRQLISYRSPQVLFAYSENDISIMPVNYAFKSHVLGKIVYISRA
jgi:hypothetical protein